jgi:hypothetical protein
MIFRQGAGVPVTTARGWPETPNSEAHHRPFPVGLRLMRMGGTRSFSTKAYVFLLTAGIQD